MALAAVEGYRILVSETRNNKIPKAVSLLDYAGFRYGADLKAKPVRWDDMEQAVQFGDGECKSIDNQVSNVQLKNAMDGALANMGRAVSSKSKQLAESSTKSEQDLVDKLESYFNNHAGP
jgi:hypothetical protein